MWNQSNDYAKVKCTKHLAAINPKPRLRKAKAEGWWRFTGSPLAVSTCNDRRWLLMRPEQGWAWIHSLKFMDTCSQWIEMCLLECHYPVFTVVHFRRTKLSFLTHLDHILDHTVSYVCQKRDKTHFFPMSLYHRVWDNFNQWCHGGQLLFSLLCLVEFSRAFGNDHCCSYLALQVYPNIILCFLPSGLFFPISFWNISRHESWTLSDVPFRRTSSRF